MTTATATTATTVRPVPGWARLAAHAVPLCVLPCGLWRIALGLGAPLGLSGELAEIYRGPDWTLTPYVLFLSLFTEAFALLTLGLVRPWGEVFPRWLPGVGGRRVPVTFAVTAAALGALIVMTIMAQVAANWSSPQLMGNPGAPRGALYVLMAACYAPALAWGPLLLAVTVAYARRRTSA